MKFARTIPAVVVLFAACASAAPEAMPAAAPTPQPQVQAPAPAPASRPFAAIGVYDFTTAVEGQTLNGLMEILKKPDGTMGGKFTTDMTGEVPITSVVVEGMKVTVSAAMPEGTLTFIMEFKNANDFEGTWAYAGTSGAFTGKRKVM